MNPDNQESDELPEESEEPRRPPPKQPHQWALWLSVFLIAVFYLAMPVISQAPALTYALGVTFYPLRMLLGSLRFPEIVGMSVTLIASLLWLYFLCYVPIKLLSYCSVALQRALFACAVLAAITWCLFRAYEEKTDWTSRGLNPERPGYHPTSVILAGTYTLTEQDGTSHGHFEIRMRGAGYYYLKRWRISRLTGRMIYQLRAITPESAFRAGSGRKGGARPLNLTTEIIPARRLWHGSQFVGADPTVLNVATGLYWEVFKDLGTYGPWLIPHKIEIRHHSANEWLLDELYVIRKVEFQTWPEEDWFNLVKRKHWERDRTLRAEHLNEPGTTRVHGGF